MSIDKELVSINEKFKRLVYIVDTLLALAQADDEEYEMHNYEDRLKHIKRELKNIL